MNWVVGPTYDYPLQIGLAKGCTLDCDLCIIYCKGKCSEPKL